MKSISIIVPVYNGAATIQKCLKAILNLDYPEKLLEIIKVTDFDRWIMVKAANMKLSFDKESGAIVNTSGGGCPDIPYLHVEMIGKTLSEAPQPKEMGYTLCARMLDIAFEKSRELWKEGS